jgi:hypothetical protein
MKRKLIALIWIGAVLAETNKSSRFSPLTIAGE